jgi:hypothetical protein
MNQRAGDAERIAPEVLDELGRLEKAATPGPRFYGETLLAALRNAAPALISAARESLTQRERIAELEERLIGATSAADANAAAVDHFKNLSETRLVARNVFQQRAEDAEKRLAVYNSSGFADADALAEKFLTLTQKLAEAERRLLDQEDAEAAVCPEDVGFAEYIKVLQARLAEAERERDEEKALLNFHDKHPRSVGYGEGYCGATGGWFWSDDNHAHHDAEDLRAAIRAARAAQGGTDAAQ